MLGWKTRKENGTCRVTFQSKEKLFIFSANSCLISMCFFRFCTSWGRLMSHTDTQDCNSGEKKENLKTATEMSYCIIRNYFAYLLVLNYP